MKKRMNNKVNMVWLSTTGNVVISGGRFGSVPYYGGQVQKFSSFFSDRLLNWLYKL